MTATSYQQCPLCKNNAEYKLVDRDNSKKFDCNKCTEFVISRCAEKHLINGNPEWRDELSEKARQGNVNNILVVTTFGLPRKSEGFNYLKKDFIERKEVLEM